VALAPAGPVAFTNQDDGWLQAARALKGHRKLSIRHLQTMMVFGDRAPAGPMACRLRGGARPVVSRITGQNRPSPSENQGRGLSELLGQGAPDQADSLQRSTWGPPEVRLGKGYSASREEVFAIRRPRSETADRADSMRRCLHNAPVGPVQPRAIPHAIFPGSIDVQLPTILGALSGPLLGEIIRFFSGRRAQYPRSAAYRRIANPHPRIPATWGAAARGLTKSLRVRRRCAEPAVGGGRGLKGAPIVTVQISACPGGETLDRNGREGRWTTC